MRLMTQPGSGKLDSQDRRNRGSPLPLKLQWLSPDYRNFHMLGLLSYDTRPGEIGPDDAGAGPKKPNGAVNSQHRQV